MPEPIVVTIALVGIVLIGMIFFSIDLVKQAGRWLAISLLMLVIVLVGSRALQPMRLPDFSSGNVSITDFFSSRAKLGWQNILPPDLNATGSMPAPEPPAIQPAPEPPTTRIYSSPAVPSPVPVSPVPASPNASELPPPRAPALPPLPPESPGAVQGTDQIGSNGSRGTAAGGDRGSTRQPPVSGWW